MYKTTLLLLFLFPYSIYSQSISGIVYHSQSTAERITVHNISQKITTYTDDKGVFNISAKINDTLRFESFLYKTKTLQIKAEHFKETIVVEVEKIVNQLEEVLLQETPKEKEFIAEEFNQNFKNQIKLDMKLHPEKYAPPASGNIDFIAIGKMIGKLFKKKRKHNIKLEPITYKEIDSLFQKDDFFNEDLLTKNLLITKEYKYLFFEYCEAKLISQNLLKPKNKFILLDTLIKFSNEFLEIINNYKKE
ncbi:hypothetical protein [Pontimicrobium sp. IMCC45349]|uniref:hypothetical protein n=1 Tax=Pontimicrobium sp. IMCC45349 TaxID=3391574 RepID=UPI0039A0DE04